MWSTLKNYITSFLSLIPAIVPLAENTVSTILRLTFYYRTLHAQFPDTELEDVGADLGRSDRYTHRQWHWKNSRVLSGTPCSLSGITGAGDTTELSTRAPLVHADLCTAYRYVTRPRSFNFRSQAQARRRPRRYNAGRGSLIIIISPDTKSGAGSATCSLRFWELRFSRPVLRRLSADRLRADTALGTWTFTCRVLNSAFPLRRGRYSTISVTSRRLYT
ncbi:hypothetical protein EVAR_21373_1 [Eumeta japonica]|uniref:Uncharacterized protein n=1 Tax=Eumeta variegata TaxID=151549 RepID=A0A4C1YG42_EUMVA|nr:hypothetical protein EVAR_21373_1 [Eumeta japonica]